MTQHRLTVLTADSCYVGQKCPVSKTPLQPGDYIIICRQGNHEESIVSCLEGLSYLKGVCPLCGRSIDIPLSSLPESPSENQVKKPSSSSPSRELRVQRLVIPVAVAMSLMACTLSLLALSAWRRSIQETQTQQTEGLEPSVTRSMTYEPSFNTTPTPNTAASPTSVATNSSPTPDFRVYAQEAVEQFQSARAIAYGTWNTDDYYSVLSGSALESAIQTVHQIRAANCRYHIIDSTMTLRFDTVSMNYVIVIASRSEVQERICAGTTSYTCYDFDARYVVESLGGQWYITDKSVLDLTETSPCP